MAKRFGWIQSPPFGGVLAGFAPRGHAAIEPRTTSQIYQIVPKPRTEPKSGGARDQREASRTRQNDPRPATEARKKPAGPSEGALKRWQTVPYTRRPRLHCAKLASDPARSVARNIEWP